jgi:hypothetical protein
MVLLSYFALIVAPRQDKTITGQDKTKEDKTNQYKEKGKRKKTRERTR